MDSPASRHQLVVIDDDIDTQDIVTGFFKPKGYQVTTFSNAELALDFLKQTTECEVVITDLQLPGMSGLELTKKIKSIRTDLPIIIMTATRSAETAIEAIQHGAYDFIVKPIHFPQLQISVERALQLKDLKEDIQSLKNMVKEKESQLITGIIGRSPNFVSALDVAKRVAKSSANIFIAGESGTGKEVIARYIHSESNRKKGPFVAINCSAIPENLLESELFGHAKGAFTGAIDKKIGLFEEAENGTLFLDEIGDLSLPLQAKLLRVLQEKKIKRVGENQSRPINARIISATHKSLQEEIATGKFREDLFFRLDVIPINLPPLRERKEDIIPLAEFFLKKYAPINGSSAKSFSKEAIQYLLSRPWKGNVRELENAIERAVIMSAGTVVERDDLGIDCYTAPVTDIQQVQPQMPDLDGCFYLKFDGKLLPLQDMVQKYIEFAVAKNGGAKDKTAKELGIDRKTLYRRIHSNNIEPELRQ